MKHPEEIKRIYTKPDDEMLLQSDVQSNSFQEHKDQFVARFPQLADPFAEEWASATTNARGFIPDYEAVNEQTNQTQILENMMERGRNLFQTVILYAQIAFPGNSAILRLFGHSQYDDARTNQLKLPMLLRTAFGQVSKEEYKPALLAKGLKEEDIALLDSLAGEIIEQNIAQQSMIEMRSLAASERIKTMNAVWEKMALVCQCAKLVFQNDAARYNLFLLTDDETPKDDNPPAPTN